MAKIRETISKIGGLLTAKKTPVVKDQSPIVKEVARPTTGGVRNIWSTYPSSGLTPIKLAQILRDADQGSIYHQMELFEEMEEKDLHLFSVLQTRKRSVANLPWEIVPASDSRHDKKIAEAVREQIRYIPTFKQALRDLLDAIGKGFAVSEIMWGISDKEVYVEELISRHQKWFTFDRETGRELRLRTDRYSTAGEALEPNKFITPVFLAKSGIPARGGLLRICTWMYLFKNYGVKDWVAFAEIFGMPFRVGKYPPGATDKDMEVLLQALVNLGQDAAAMIPESMMIEFIQAKISGSLNTHEGLVNFCDQQISKGVLGQTLTTESGDKGSYALGTVHQEVRYDLIQSDAEELDEVINEQLIRPLVIYNYGEQENYPRYRMIATEPEDMKALAENVGTLSKAGLRIPVAWVYDKFGIPVPKDGEEVLEPSSGGAPFSEDATVPAKNQPSYVLAGKKKLDELRGYPTKSNLTA